VVFPYRGLVVGEEVKQRSVVAQQFVVGAESEMQLAVARFQLAEYMLVKVFVFLYSFGNVVLLSCGEGGKMSADGGEDVPDGVDAPDDTGVEMTTAESIVTSHAAAENQVGLFFCNDLLQLVVNCLRGKAVVVECGGNHMGFRKHCFEFLGL
jgi:hypothetical protein